jgi:hypothetical protein
MLIEGDDKVGIDKLKHRCHEKLSIKEFIEAKHILGMRIE